MKSGSDVQITKASGEQVPFSEEKLRQSLERAGATEMYFESQRKDMVTGERGRFVSQSA